VARSGINGNHENEGTQCVSFNRTHWPHGDFGDAKPHSELFVVADEDLR
jgi:hypothetical protein